MYVFSVVEFFNVIVSPTFTLFKVANSELITHSNPLKSDIISPSVIVDVPSVNSVIASYEEYPSNSKSPVRFLSLSNFSFDFVITVVVLFSVTVCLSPIWPSGISGLLPEPPVVLVVVFDDVDVCLSSTSYSNESVALLNVSLFNEVV